MPKFSPPSLLLPALALLTALAHVGWLVFRWGSPAQAEWYSDLHSLAVIYVSTLLCLVALRGAPPHLRGGLVLLGQAMAIRSVADSIWTYLELFTETPPFPSLADLFYLLEYPCFGLAFLRLSYVPLRPLKAVRLALDSLIVVGTAATLLWWVLLAGVLEAPGSSPLVTLISMSYPVFDLGLLGPLLLVVLHGKRLQSHLALFALGCACTILADLGFVYLVNHGGYRTGHPVDVLFTCGFLMWGLGAWQLRRSARGAGSLAPPAPLDLAPWIQNALALIPYAAVGLACMFLLSLSHLEGPRERGMMVGTLLTVLLVMTRQAVAFADNAYLTRSLRASRAQLAYQAYHDQLTGLPNRTLFESRLTQALRAEGSLAVLFIDLDGFKQVNDRYGHAAGDEVLQQVASRLQEAVRDGDTVARQGGDEFLALLSLHHGWQAATTATRMLTALTAPYVTQGQEVTLTASIGVSLYPQDAREAGELRRCADLAMYRAKEAGKNGVQFFATGESPRLPCPVERRLATAMERGDLTLHYQPQFGVRGERVVAAEALLRWTDAELEAVPPDQFIAVAEDSGLIVPIGTWVLDEACRQTALWRQQGWTGRVAVNVSPVQLAQPEFAETVMTTLKRHGLRGPELELEITERAVVEDAHAASGTLTQLRDQGVRLAVDDFGMGHTALMYLLHFPVDVLKIDRRFVQGALERDHERRVVQALVTFARALNLEVVAEGVETPEQQTLMERLGVQWIQGFLLGRPVPAYLLSARLVGDHPPPRSGTERHNA